MLEECLETDEHELVGYDIPPMRNPYITKQDRRQMRVQNRFSRFPPLNMWANWLLNTKCFQYYLVFFIVLNALVLGIHDEIVDKVDDTSNILVVSLDILDCIITYVFISEIILRWIDDFFEFWKNNSKLCGMVETKEAKTIQEDLDKLRNWMNTWKMQFNVEKGKGLHSILPELLDDGSAATINLQFVKVIKILHVLRSLKMVSKVRQAMSFILLFLTIFFYIFTITGVLLFSDYSLSTVSDLEFSYSFMDIPNTLVTLFILFTLDHWYAMAREILKVVELDHASCIIFIILWIFIGAFIFRNIFVGIMVNNFQAIRNELMKDFQQIEEQLKADQFKVEALNRRRSKMSISGRYFLFIYAFIIWTLESTVIQKNNLGMRKTNMI
ncbi:cation channel sperm-associated protein 2-like [Polypterus senegalus]|uniref:cation channel sperm-associated protein 2-like n=1 Tax=Polypterus senegalus TaxID=55291 RepID=UPI00196274FF|nr:cation channel sperm-associated protein 2-like [Polypterus senegalus]